jgi:amino acid transporter
VTSESAESVCASSSANTFRKIGFLPLLAVFYGYCAAGPFGYEEIYSLSGPGMAILFLAFVPLFWSVPVSLGAAELNGILPVQGGFYRWVRAAFGDFWGFQAGWWNWAGTFLLNSLYGVLIVDYLANYIPALAGFWKWPCACLFLCGLAYLNVRGIQAAGWVATAMQIVILVPVAWMCGLSLLHWRFNPMVPLAPPGKPLGVVFGAGLALAMWNYAGFEQLSTTGEEIEGGQKTFLRALWWNSGLVTLTYLIPGTLALAALGNWSAWKTGYIVEAARQIGGPVLGALMLIASILGTAALSNSTILFTTRMPQAMAEDGYLPRWLAKIDPRYGTPARAIVFSAVIYCALARASLVELVDIYIWTRIATTLLTLLAAWQLRRKLPEAPRSFKIPGGALGLAYIVIFPALLCAVKVYYSGAFVFRWAPWLMLSGPVMYVVLRFAFGLRPAEKTVPG